MSGENDYDFSECVGVCEDDPQTGICLGCGRRRWPIEPQAADAGAMEDEKRPVGETA